MSLTRWRRESAGNCVVGIKCQRQNSRHQHETSICRPPYSPVVRKLEFATNVTAVMTLEQVTGYH